MFFSSSSGDRSYTVSFRTVDTLHSSYLLRPKDSRALLWHLIRRSWDEREKEIELLGFSDTRKEVRGGGERARKISSVSKDHRFLLDRFVPLYPSPSSKVEKAPLPFLLLHNSVHGIIRRYLISAMNRGRKFSPLRLLRNKSREAEEEGGGGRRASLAKSIAFIASSAERFSCSPREVHATPAKVAITGRVVALPPRPCKRHVGTSRVHDTPATTLPVTRDYFPFYGRFNKLRADGAPSSVAS